MRAARWGFWSRACARGIEAFGLDVSEYAIRRVRDDLKPYCWLASLADPIPGRYDLIVCIEVLEHLAPAEGEQAVENLCQAGDDILFSSSPHDFAEATHFNVQPPEHWAERFALRGFARDLAFDASFINPWAVRFRRVREPWHRVVGGYERRLWRLQQEIHDLRRLTTENRDQLAALERRLRRSPIWQLAQALWRGRRGR